MNFKDVKVGMQVLVYGNREDMATVISLSNDGDELVECKWPSGRTFLEEADEMQPYDPEEEQRAVEAAQRSLDESVSVFEQAFFLLQQAETTARSVGISLRNDDYFNVSKLNQVVEKNGWSSSSIWC